MIEALRTPRIHSPAAAQHARGRACGQARAFPGLQSVADRHPRVNYPTDLWSLYLREHAILYAGAL